jgi:hypothetical protein
MATTTATITINSSDLLTDELSLSSVATLTQAGNSTGIVEATGLSRRSFTYGSEAAIDTTTLLRANDYTTNGANKVYMKNMSATPAEYFTVWIDQEEMGRLYAGDWCLFPWGASDGTEETFQITIANTWAAGDTWDFDGVTTTAANSTAADIATQIDAQFYPNWVTSVSSATVTFVARIAGAAGVVASSSAINGDTVTTAGDGTAAVTNGAVGTRSESDISIKPSVHNTDMTMEWMVLKG